MNIKNNSSIGYVLEADLEYPQKLHDIHSDYPLAPEKINMPKEWLSDDCLRIANVQSINILQNIAINHSADIEYKDFVKIYRECTKEPYNFLIIDTKLPASNPLGFRKNLFDSYKNDNN